MIDLEPAARELAMLLAGVRDDQLKGPTPRPEYTLGDLIDHVSGISLAFAAAAAKNIGAATGRALPADGGRLGEDWRTRIANQLGVLAEAWRDEVAWTGTTEVGGTRTSGAAAGRLALNELVVHGWDVARASGQPYAGDARAVQECWDFAVAATPDDQTADPDGPFGSPADVATDAPLLDRLIGLRGRDPQWTST